MLAIKGGIVYHYDENSCFPKTISFFAELLKKINK
jgi:hypothetical protein